MYLHHYESPLGELTAAANQEYIRGLWFSDTPRPRPLSECSDFCPEEGSPIFQALDLWLDRYFSGMVTSFPPPFKAEGTAFQKQVWTLLSDIPYGETRSYGQLAEQLGQPGCSRAVGAALGRNPILLLIPCHRVISASGSLSGYAGGRERKAALLQMERQGTRR